MAKTTKKLRLTNSTHFTFVLLGSIVILSFLFWQILVYFPEQWDWVLAFKRRTGKPYQSAFAMISLISGLLGGIALTDAVRRSWEKGIAILSVFPVSCALLSVFELRFLQINGYAPQEINLFQGLLLLLWFLNMIVLYQLLKFINRILLSK